MTQQRARRPTIRDVAREAGVSYGTVSRFLNGGKWVSIGSQQAIEAAIRRTGYTTNPHARSLVTGRSRSIAFLLPEPQNLLFEDPTFAILLRSLAQAVSARNLTLILMIASSREDRTRVLEYLSARHVDGVLLVSSHFGDPLIPRLVATGVPIVATGRIPDFDGTISMVTADDFTGARMATEHLIATGRRRIAMITGPLDTSGGAARLQGYLQTLQSKGFGTDNTLIAHGDWSRVSGAAALRTILDRHPDLDAVFAANDLMAAGALGVLRESGRSVPDDVHVVGFDDTGLAETLDPPLTTIRQPLDEVAEEMIKVICEATPGTSVTIPTSLVVRASAPGG